MSTDAPQTPEGAAPAEIAPRKQLLARIKPAFPDWRPAAKRAAGAIAAVAAVGAVLGGLVGFWSTYKVVVGEWLAEKPAVVSQAKTEATPVLAQPQRLSLAVMPFDNLSGDVSKDYFGDGIVDNLTTDISVHVANLLVMARNSSFIYKGQKIDPKQIGRELNVRYLLQGSVLHTDKNVRINARLIEVESGAQLWAERFDGDTSNILSLQDRITARLANSLRLEILSAGARQVEKRIDPDALDMTLRAQVALSDERRRGINPRKQAQEYYRKAVEFEPDNPMALTGLAGVLAEDRLNTRSLPQTTRPSPDQVAAMGAEVLELLQRASKRQALTSDAHQTFGVIYYYDKQFDAAIQAYKQALSINPNNTVARNGLAGCYSFSGRPVLGFPHFEEILARTSGKLPGFQTTLGDWANTLVLAGRWEEAIDKAQQALALREEGRLRRILAIALAQSGKLEQGKAELENGQKAWTALYGRPLTIRTFISVLREWSEHPEYLKLLEATHVEGLRKLGVPEE